MLNYIEKGFSLHQALLNLGYIIMFENGLPVLVRTDNQPLVPADYDTVNAFIANYDPMLPLKAKAIIEIKTVAANKILLILPDWKQRNLAARATELLEIRVSNGYLDVQQQAEWDAAANYWNRIKAIRAHSDTLEGWVAAQTDVPTVEQFDAAAPPTAVAWPE